MIRSAARSKEEVSREEFEKTATDSLSEAAITLV
jgi:hypothetical protein